MSDYNEKIKKIENFSSNIYGHIESFVKEEQNSTKLWKEDAILDQVKKKLRKQLETIQQNQLDSSHKVQVDFLKLRKIQRKIVYWNIDKIYWYRYMEYYFSGHLTKSKRIIF